MQATRIPTAISATVRIALSRVQYVKSSRLQPKTLMTQARLMADMLCLKLDEAVLHQWWHFTFSENIQLKGKYACARTHLRPSANVTLTPIFLGVGNFIVQKTGSGSNTIMTSSTILIAAAAISASPTLLQCPGIVLFQLYSIGVHSLKVVVMLPI